MKQWSFSSYRSIASNHYLSYQLNMPFQPSRFGLHFVIMGLATAEYSFCTFLMTKQILNSSQNCDSCYLSATALWSWLPAQSPNQKIFLFGDVDTARRQRTSDPEVSFNLGSSLPFQRFLLLIFYFSSKSITNIKVGVYKCWHHL